MANIKVKRSAVPGKVPLVGDLALGEFAVNTYDGKVYIKKNVDGTETVVDIADAGGPAIDLLNLNSGLATADFLKFDVAATNTPEVAKLNWNPDDGTLEFGLKGGQVVLPVGQKQVQRIYNNTGNTLVSGQVVYVTGSQGNRLTVALASASGESTSTRTFGVVTETILNEAEGFIATSGLVRKLDTSSFAEGSVLWLGTSAGTYTTTRPAAPNHGVLVGFVVRQHASVGSIFVHIANGYELNELHDVLISSKTEGQALVYEASSGLWKNKFVDYDTLLNKPTLVTQTDIDNAIAALVDTAPTTLDTLNELAAALGDDPNFATTVTNLVAAKQDTLVSGTNIKTVNGTSILGSGNIQIDGGVTSFNTRTGAVTLSSSDVITALGYTPYNSTNPSGYITSSASITGNAATATALQTARTINGVSFDGTANITVADSTKLPLAGGTMTGAITFAAGQTWPTFNQSTTGNAATATKINSQGNYANSDPGTTRGPAGLNFYTVYNNGYPTTYGNLIHVNGGGGGQLLIGWSGTDGAHAPNYIRSKRDNDSGAWSPWALLLTDVNYNSYSPTLTGSGASGTWGINITGNAGTAYGLNVHTGRNNEANKVVRTDGNGYIQAGWINTDSGDNGTTSLARIYASQDGYIRYYTPANFNTVKNRAIFNRESHGGTMVAGNIYSIYTGGGALAMYLPTVANTAQGDTIWITNLHMTWAANNFTIGKNGNTYINYIAESLVCNINVPGLTLVCNYHDGTNAFWSAF